MENSKRSLIGAVEVISDIFSTKHQRTVIKLRFNERVVRDKNKRMSRWHWIGQLI